MDQRLLFHSKLSSVLPGVALFFSKPPDTELVYPCVIYTRSRAKALHANGKKYSVRPMFTCVLMTNLPDDHLFNILENMSLSTHDRSYLSDDINHDVFTIYL